MLKSQNIHLRTLEPSDIDFLYTLENNPENWKVSNTKVPFSRELLLQYINSAQDIFITSQIRFVICKNDTSIPIGSIDLFEYDPINQRAGVGIIITKENRRNSFATEALQLIKSYSFNHLLLHGLYCNIMESNKTSINLFKSNGFIQKGIKKDWLKTKTGWEDELFFQINSQH